MELFNFLNEDYQTGIKEIDEQHRQLIACLDRLHSYMEKGKGMDHILEIMDELEAYTHHHFEFEENLVSQRNPGANNDHKKQHAKFYKDLEELRAQVNNHASSASGNTLTFMDRWWKRHILHTDMIALGLPPKG